MKKLYTILLFAFVIHNAWGQIVPSKISDESDKSSSTEAQSLDYKKIQETEMVWKFSSSDPKVTMTSLSFEGIQQTISINKKRDTTTINVANPNLIRVQATFSGPKNSAAYWKLELWINGIPIYSPQALKLDGHLDAEGKGEVDKKCSNQ